jgi:hypothetical protein
MPSGTARERSMNEQVHRVIIHQQDLLQLLERFHGKRVSLRIVLFLTQLPKGSIVQIATMHQAERT